MQCCVNGVSNNKVPKFLASVPSETTHVIQIENPLNATHPIIFPLKLNGVTSYFEVRIPTQEESQDRTHSKRALNSAGKNRVCLITGDGLSSLTLKQEDN